MRDSSDSSRESEIFDRRKFITGAKTVGAFAGLGGIFWAGRAYSRESFASDLLHRASPTLVAKEHDELLQLPKLASDQLYLWFTGACLNASVFVDYICSEGFATRLSEHTGDREKQICVETEFYGRVLSPNSIVEELDVLGAEIGAVLDRNWRDCCLDVAEKWQLKIDPSRSNVKDGFIKRIEPLVNAELGAMVARCAKTAGRPSLISTVRAIGRDCRFVVPMVLLPPPFSNMVVPLCVASAVTRFAAYFLSRPDIGSQRAALTEQVALLGKRIAADFSKEVEVRVADVHAYQNTALRSAARNYANDAIRYF